MNKLTSQYYFRRISKSQDLSELNQNWKNLFSFWKRRQDYATQRMLEGYANLDLAKIIEANKVVVETMVGA